MQLVGAMETIAICRVWTERFSILALDVADSAVSAEGGNAKLFIDAGGFRHLSVLLDEKLDWIFSGYDAHITRTAQVKAANLVKTLCKTCSDGVPVAVEVCA